jgi:hypothetical protein
LGLVGGHTLIASFTDLIEFSEADQRNSDDMGLLAAGFHSSVKARIRRQVVITLFSGARDVLARIGDGITKSASRRAE